MIRSVCHHLPQGGDGKLVRVKWFIPNKEIRLINPDQRIELIKLNQGMRLIKPNQGMGLINSSKDIKLWQIDRCSIMIDGMTLNNDSKDNQSYLEIIFEA